ncbi:MAG: bifunctional phosphopantothenoylcysteine decarboxylase/phosphopantothenate--cysteine ligase CoaBC [Methanosarcinales archaeon]
MTKLIQTLRVRRDAKSDAKSNSLDEKTIVLGVTGSIAAVRTIELARELIRHGAKVFAVMTSSAQKILHSNALQYATGNKVITEITGRVEHVEFCGIDGIADLLLIAPCTANTIGKIANGIDDTPITTFATTALGSGTPIMIVPAMHQSMYDHPIILENIKKLKELGVYFLEPKIEEKKAKIPDNSEIVLHVERLLYDKRLPKKILITSGATIEYIDPIRILTNRSSGKTGIELAKEAYRRGAEVVIVHRNRIGLDRIKIKEIFVETANDMLDAVLTELKNKDYDILISVAAISDYTLDMEKEKIKSGLDLTLKLKPTPKLIKVVREKYPNLKIIGFKAETNVSKEELIKRAKNAMIKYQLDLMVANDVGGGGIGTEDNEVYIIGDQIDHVKGSKKKIAIAILDRINFFCQD